MCSTPSAGRFPWPEGTYRVVSNGEMVYTVNINGHLVRLADHMGEFVLEAREGSFQHPDQRGIEAMRRMEASCQHHEQKGLVVSGKDEYNVELLLYGQRKMCAVVSQAGKIWTLMNGSVWEWMGEENVKDIEKKTQAIEKVPDLKNNSRMFYSTFGRMHVQTPKELVLDQGKPGKLIWISGASGMGKTSISTCLKEKHGLVHYEGDCFLFGLNPFVRKGRGGGEGWITLADEMMFCEQVYTELCGNILMEQDQVGGDWVVSQGIYSRARRDQVREVMGARLRLVVLEMDLALLVRRFQKREVGSEDMAEEVFEAKKKERIENMAWYEPVEDDEKDVIRIQITEMMTVEDIANAIFDRI